MKGIEGMALQYIVLIVVAAIVVGAVFTIITTFTNTAGSQAKTLNQTVSTGFNASTAKACTGFGGTWNSTTNTCT